ncbi:MAG: PhoU domain-containing protein [Pirellulales bacterium]
MAAIVTVCLQSSTATLGLVIGLGAAGSVDLPLGVAVVAGANVGIVITLLIVGWNQVASRRLAVAMLIAKLIVAGIVVANISHIIPLLRRLPGNIDQHVAYAHTGFNVAVAVLFLPLVTPLHRLAEWLVPGPPPSATPIFGPRYIHTGRADSVPLALDQSARELMHVAEIARGMLGDLWRALKENDARLAEAVSERDDQVDLLDAEIKQFLTSLISLGEDPSNAQEQMRQLRYLNELETIGDIIDKNLTELVVKKAKLDVHFSAEGWQDLDDMYGRVYEDMLIAETAFTTGERMYAQQLLRHKEKVNQLEREMRDRHFARLNAGLAESFETSAIHLDVLTHLKRINSCVTQVAYAILDNPPGREGRSHNEASL